MTKQRSLGILAITGALFLGVLSLGQGAQARHHGYGGIGLNPEFHIHAPHHGNWDTVGHIQHGESWAHGESHLNWGSDDSGGDSGSSDSGGDSSGGDDGGDSGDGGDDSG